MKPYFETENGKLYYGDCLEILPSLCKVDLILTDPPYGINFQSCHRKQKYKKIQNDDNLKWLSEMYRKTSNLLKNHKHAYFFSPYQKLDEFMIKCREYYKLKNVLIWEKSNTGMGDLYGDYAPKYEPILFCSDGKLKLNGRRDPSIIQSRKTGNKLHPTQKPADLFMYLIGKSTGKNETVLDPFIGSGTTAVACEEIDRKWIGIEKEEKYCEIAALRIEQSIAQLKLPGF